LGSIIGSLVADAASQPLHWIYSRKVSDVLAERKVAKDGSEILPSFVDPSANPFYTLPTGRFSVYGDQTYLLLRSLVKHHGLDPTAYSKEFAAFFGNEGEGGYGPFPTDDVPKDKLPIKLPWRNHSIKIFLKSLGEQSEEKKWLHSGAADDQSDGAAKIAPLVGLYAGTGKLIERVEEAVKVSQASEIAISRGVVQAVVLEAILLGESPLDAIKAAPKRLGKYSESIELAKLGEQIEGVLKSVDTPHQEVVAKLGLSCALPCAQLNAFHSAFAYDHKKTPTATSTDRYVEAVHSEILAGGDICSRGLQLGALLGANLGIKGIPTNWIAKVEKEKEILNLAKQLIEVRRALLAASSL